MITQKKFHFRGYWWKYDNPSKKVPSNLEIINNEKISLKPGDLFSIKNGTITSFMDKIGTILGETLKKEPITLLNCESFMGFNLISHMALVGGHYKDFDEIKFKKIKINYSLLNVWAYPDWIKSYTVENNKVLRNYFKKDKISVKIPEFNLIIDFHFNLKTIKKDPSNKERITFIFITSKELKGLTEWWDIIITLRNFIILGLNVPIYPNEFVGITDKQRQVKIYRTAYGYNYNSIEEINRKGILFTLKNIEDGFSIYLNYWFKKSVKFNRTITNYYSILNNPDMYNEDKLLNFVSLIEGYHRYNKKNEIDGMNGREDYEDKFKKILIDAEKYLEEKQVKFLKDNKNLFGYEKRLGQRLKELLNENKALIPLNSKDKNRFIIKVKYTRDFWAHKLEEEKDKLLKRGNLFKAVIALEMLLIICLLREIEFKDELLIKLFKGNNKFTYSYNNILSLFKLKS